VSPNDTLRFRAEGSDVFVVVVEALAVWETSRCAMGWPDVATPGGSLEGDADKAVVALLAYSFSRGFCDDYGLRKSPRSEWVDSRVRLGAQWNPESCPL
jgi:hypothetical protein